MSDLSKMLEDNTLTPEERKWVQALKRCLNKKPHTIEVLVQEQYNNINGIRSEFHIMKRGVIYQSAEDNGHDLMMYSPSEFSVTHWSVEDWAGNNHGY